MCGSASMLAVARRPHRFARRNSSRSESLSRSALRLTFATASPLRQDFPLELDPSLLAVPRLRRDPSVAQVALLELVRLGPRQLVHVLDEARDPVARHPPGEVVDELRRIQLRTLLEHDADLALLVAGRLVEIRVLHRNGRDVLNERMADDLGLDLVRRDVHRAPADHVLLA